MVSNSELQAQLANPSTLGLQVDE